MGSGCVGSKPVECHFAIHNAVFTSQFRVIIKKKMWKVLKVKIIEIVKEECKELLEQNLFWKIKD